MSIRINPGYDHHNHPLLYSLLGSGVDISSANNIREASEIIGASMETWPGEIILVTGWNNSKFDLIQSHLNEFPKPVIAFNVSFHGAILNSTAEKIIGFQNGDMGFEGNGVVIEQAIFRTLDYIALDVEQNKAGLLAQQAELFSLGIVAVDDMFVNSVAQVEAYKALMKSGQLKMQLNMWFRPKLIRDLVRTDPNSVCLCEGVKYILDGAFGVRTAALQKPYCDDPENKGMLLWKPGALQMDISDMLDHRVKKVAIHCIGDEAIKHALGVYNIFNRWGHDTRGWRIEHAELISEKQARIANKLGVQLCFQPNFVTDCQDYGDRLGDRIYKINPFRMLIDTCYLEPGKHILFGSDGMPTGLLHGLRTAVNGFSPAQSLSLGEALAGYTVRPKNLDSTVINYVELSGDPLDPATTILRTVVDGEEVYKAS